jgi:hypothetical protein
MLIGRPSGPGNRHQPNEKRFEAQQMVMLLGTLAHHVVIWARRWLTQTARPAKLRHYGILRLFTPGLAPRVYATATASCLYNPQRAVRAHCSSAAAGSGRER